MRPPALVSILTPTYEHVRFIGECIESAIAQTVADWEMFVIDDGSGDGTAARASEVRDPRIEVMARPHGGLDSLAETFNAGLDRARGTYIGILEGDDRWLPDKLKFQLRSMSHRSVVLTYGRYAVIGAHGRVLTVPPRTGPTVEGPFDAFGALLEDQFIMPLTVLIRRETLVAAGGFRQLPGHGHIDYVTFLELSQRGQFVGADRVVAHWRRHATSETARAADIPGYFRGPLQCRDYALATLARRMPESSPEYAQARRRIVHGWNRALARRYWHTGRVLNAQGRWKEARTLFVRGLQVPATSLLQRAAFLAGIAASALRVNLEALIARVRGGAAFSDLRA